MTSNNSLYLRLPRETWIGIWACVAYSVTSLTTTLSNKVLLSVFKYNNPTTLLLYQSTFSVLCLSIGKHLGYLNYQPLQMPIIQEWFPVNLLFVAMLVTSNMALKFLSIPMVTIFKNLTTTLVALGDFYLFGTELTSGVLASIAVMVLSSVVAGFNDLQYSFEGYCWMFANCIFAAWYLLYMRHVMKKVRLTEFGSSFYNNVFTIPIAFVVMYINGEVPALFGGESSESNTSTAFYAALILCIVSGLLISLASFWAVGTTSPTTYSMVGGLNKIPLTIIGFLFFHTPANGIGITSIVIGIGAGLLYSWEKHKATKNSQTLPVHNNKV